ncbi:hypothetical protein [Azospirillum sp. A39]|uniref:hypothetical protein n=1 Tax=Azospirillum sp. A39 TaxID=3462279 RepID=UPI004045EC40
MRLLLFAALLAIAGCGPIYETQYTLIPPNRPDAAICLNQCQQIAQYCRRTCSLEEKACLADARERARDAFRDYVYERKAEGKPIKRKVSDFESTSMCGTTSCDYDCDDDYRGCYAGCGGQVIPRRVCTMFCE